MLHIDSKHDSVVEAVLKGAPGNTSLKKLTIWRLSDPDHRNTAAATELRQIRPQLELDIR